MPVLYPYPFDGPGWLFEPKYDGFRGLFYLSGRECRFRSKRGNRLRRFDQLCYWVREELGTRDVILDGEVVALGEHGRQDFRGLMAGRGNLHYAVFDVLWLKGKDLRECSLSRRKRILSRLVKKTSTVLSLAFPVILSSTLRFRESPHIFPQHHRQRGHDYTENDDASIPLVLRRRRCDPRFGRLATRSRAGA